MFYFTFCAEPTKKARKGNTRKHRVVFKGPSKKSVDEEVFDVVETSVDAEVIDVVDKSVNEDGFDVVEKSGNEERIDDDDFIVEETDGLECRALVIVRRIRTNLKMLRINQMRQVRKNLMFQYKYTDVLLCFLCRTIKESKDGNTIKQRVVFKGPSKKSLDEEVTDVVETSVDAEDEEVTDVVDKSVKKMELMLLRRVGTRRELMMMILLLRKQMDLSAEHW